MDVDINNQIKILKGLLANISRDRILTHGLRRVLRILEKELIFYANHVDGRKRISKSEKMVYPKIQIGGGSHVLLGFLNIDIVPPADIIWDIREGIPLRSNSVKFLFSEHFLEHIDYPFSVKKFIRECYRVSEKNGTVIIGVPDSERAIDAYYKRDKKLIKQYVHRWYRHRNCLNHFNTPIDFLNYHFRDQDDDKKYHPHLWAYDKEKLYSLFKEAGFKKIGKWRFNPQIANPKRKFGSIYVYGKK